MRVRRVIDTKVSGANRGREGRVNYSNSRDDAEIRVIKGDVRFSQSVTTCERTVEKIDGAGKFVLVARVERRHDLTRQSSSRYTSKSSTKH